MWFCARCVLFLLFFWLRILNLLSLLYIRVYILFIVGVKSDSWIYIFWLIDHFTPFRITICLYEHMNKLSLYNESLGFVINVWARTTNKLTAQLTFLNIKYILTFIFFRSINLFHIIPSINLFHVAPRDPCLLRCNSLFHFSTQLSYHLPEILSSKQRWPQSLKISISKHRPTSIPSTRFRPSPARTQWWSMIVICMGGGQGADTTRTTLITIRFGGWKNNELRRVHSHGLKISRIEQFISRFVRVWWMVQIHNEIPKMAKMALLSIATASITVN